MKKFITKLIAFLIYPFLLIAAMGLLIIAGIPAWIGIWFMNLDE